VTIYGDTKETDYDKRRMVIVVPAWGSYVKTFLGPVIRTHLAAIEVMLRALANTIEVRYVVVTDQQAPVARALEGFDLTLVPIKSEVPRNRIFNMLCEGHARGIDVARQGDRVVFLNADIMISREAFLAVEKRFRKGKKAVVCGGTRTVLGPLTSAPGPLPARALAKWAIEHPHMITRNFFWGSGTTTHPSIIYFRKGQNVVLRGFHIHPLALVKDRPLTFVGSVDLNLLDAYGYNEIHVVTDVDELSIAEISVKGKGHYQSERVLDVSQIVSWAMRGASPMHWWNFRHRIMIAGDGVEAGDSEAADEVLRLCPYREPLEAPL
jgi:hypothetical protein